MSEEYASGKIPAGIYRRLLRLYPVDFRSRYGDEAIALFRDRYRDERGVLAHARLWIDVLGDLAMSVPRERRRSRERAIARPAQAAGMPSFQILEGESLAPRTVLSGGVMSAVAFTMCWMLMSHWTWRPGVASNEPAGYAWAFAAMAGEPRKAEPWKREKMAAQASPAAVSVDDSVRVVEAAAANLERYYVDRDAAPRIAGALREREKAGAYNGAAGNGRALAARLTSDLRNLSGDRALIVVYSETPLRNGPPQPPPEAVARYREAMLAQNCMFRAVDLMPDHVGFFKLDAFPDPPVCESQARAAMARLNTADALIFDLRDNGGGYPAMVSLIASYLFDHPEYLYNPREATSPNSWTRSPVAGNRLADKPVFILISANTRSGAEQFSYDLKALKRATLVGEKTGGAAHSGVFHRLDEHFGMGIPEVRPINPFGEGDWDGVGIEPDVKTPAADALATARKLAAKAARKIEALRRIQAR